MEAVSASIVVSVQQESAYGPAGDSRPKMESIIPGLIQLSRVGHKLSEKVILGLDWAEPWWSEGHSTFSPPQGTHSCGFRETNPLNGWAVGEQKCFYLVFKTWTG